MALSIDGDDEHDAFQAALTFMEEYADYFDDDSMRAQDMVDDDAEPHSQRASRTSIDLDEEGTLLSLEELTSEDIVDGSTFDSENAATHAPQAPQQQRQLQKASSKKNLIKKVTKKTLKYNPNKARDERKEELIYLRKKVSELEAQLETVKAKRPPQLMAGDPMQAVVTAVLPGQESRAPMSGGFSLSLPFHPQQPPPQPPHTVVPGMWQDIASRQSEERLKSERENIRLKLVLENQIKIAKSLEKILNRKQATRELEKCVQGRHLHHLYAPTTDATDAEIFKNLLAGVDKSYAEVDAVFEANGMAHMETAHSDARMRSSGLKGMYLEIFANKVLPFDMHSTGTASWQHFIFAKQRTPYRFYHYNTPKDAMDTTDDTIVENFSLDLHANSTSGRFRVKQILRRFIEEERIVIVWRAVFEPVEFSDEPFSGMRFSEKGYILIRKPSTIVGDFSLVKTCYIFTPHFTGDLLDGNHPKVGAITDFMLSATAANVHASHQMIENVLLEQAMKKK